VVSARALSWAQADHDVFVALESGEYAGHVAVDGSTFTLFDEVGADRGSFATLADAQARLSQTGTTALTTRPARGRPRDRRDRRRPDRRARGSRASGNRPL
jgi:hypothetical protein